MKLRNEFLNFLASQLLSSSVPVTLSSSVPVTTEYPANGSLTVHSSRNVSACIFLIRSDAPAVRGEASDKRNIWSSLTAD